MSQSNEELANELKGLLGQTGLDTAFEGESEAPDDVLDDNPLETDFFKALNAYRAARTSGDARKVAEAEEHFREVVRSELTGETPQR